jgi:hypothetical protein
MTVAVGARDRFGRDSAALISQALSQTAGFVRWNYDKYSHAMVLQAVTGGSTTMLEGLATDLVPLTFDPSGRTYWIALTLEGTSNRGDYFVSSVNAKVFAGASAEPSKLLLFRAEWMFDAAPSPYEHAQPHWHVHAHNVRNPLGIAMALVGQEALGLMAPRAKSLITGHSYESWSLSYHFHFAMLGAFHVKEGSHGPDTPTLDGAALRRYISGLTRYIRMQTEYIVEKAKGI